MLMTMATQIFYPVAMCLLMSPLIAGSRNLYKEFAEDWCRERRSRQDWKTILSTCKGRSRQWGVDEWPEKKGTSAFYSYLSWVDPKPLGHYTKLHIQSVTRDKREKLIGGDAWRARVQGPSSVASSFDDLGNGTYELALLLQDPGTYIVHVFLDYTLCHGLKNPPYNWFKRGCRHGSFQPEGSLGKVDDYLHQRFKNGAIINITVSGTIGTTPQDKQALLMLMDNSINTCPERCNLVWDGFGRWINGTWQPYRNDQFSRRSMHVSGTGALWIYGDSLNRLLYESVMSRPLCTQVFRACYHTPVWVYVLTEGGHQEMDLSYGGKELDITTVLEELRAVIRQPIMDEKSALLLNAGIHLLKSTSFRNYQKIIKGMIHVLKNDYKGEVVWKTITALGEQTHLYSGCMRRFHTEQRIKLFNAYAIKKMCEADYAVLDVYPISSAYPAGTFDGVHYDNRAFYPVELVTYFRNPRLGEN